MKANPVFLIETLRGWPTPDVLPAYAAAGWQTGRGAARNRWSRCPRRCANLTSIEWRRSNRLDGEWFWRRGGDGARLGSPTLYFDFYAWAGLYNSFYCVRAGIFPVVKPVLVPLMRALPASCTRPRLSNFAVTLIEKQFMPALTRSRGTTFTACLRSKILRTSRRIYFLRSTKVLRWLGRLALSNSKPRESRDVRGLRPNRAQSMSFWKVATNLVGCVWSSTRGKHTRPSGQARSYKV